MVKTIDPVTGPLSRDEFAEAVKAPCGKAAAIIRRHDPLWGRKPGEKIRWKIEVKGRMYGTAYVMAADQKEADKLADDIDSAAVDWDDWNSDLEIITVEPDKLR